MHALIQRLINSGPVLTDGAWGTELQARGLAFGESPAAWSLTHPERGTEVAAGNQVILTNTFGATRVRLADHEWAGKLREINRAGVEISRRVAGHDALVFASMGPSGKLLLNGDVRAEELAAAFSEQADALVIETKSASEEVKIAVRAARRTGRQGGLACFLSRAAIKIAP